MKREYEIKGVKLEINMNNADFVDRYNKAFTKMKEDATKLPKTGDASDIIKAYCKAFWDLFDNIFGNGTSYSMFSEVPDQEEAEEAYAELVGICRKQVTEAQNRRAAIVGGTFPLLK